MISQKKGQLDTILWFMFTFIIPVIVMITLMVRIESTVNPESARELFLVNDISLVIDLIQSSPEYILYEYDISGVKGKYDITNDKVTIRIPQKKKTLPKKIQKKRISGRSAYHTFSEPFVGAKGDARFWLEKTTQGFNVYDIPATKIEKLNFLKKELPLALPPKEAKKDIKKFIQQNILCDPFVNLKLEKPKNLITIINNQDKGTNYHQDLWKLLGGEKDPKNIKQFTFQSKESLEPYMKKGTLFINIKCNDEKLKLIISYPKKENKKLACSIAKEFLKSEPILIEQIPQKIMQNPDIVGITISPKCTESIKKLSTFALPITKLYV